MRKFWICELYPDNSMYQDDANQTIGKPIFDYQTIANRRNVSNKLNPDGKQFIEKVKQYFRDNFNIEVKASFSKHCGCSMCPCSPGFKIICESDTLSPIKSRNDFRMKIWGNEKGDLDIRYPKNDELFMTMKPTPLR